MAIKQRIIEDITQDGIAFSSITCPLQAAAFTPFGPFLYSDATGQANSDKIINAVDIDWNGAKPNIPNIPENGITTTGDLVEEVYSPMFAKAA